jgi:hypothetical protein
MTVGKGQHNRYIVIHPGTTSFESKNPGALCVALSRAKSAGGNGEDPDFAWHPNVLVNEDRLCQLVNTATTRARAQEIKRIDTMTQSTADEFSNLNTEDAFNSTSLRQHEYSSMHEE